MSDLSFEVKRIIKDILLAVDKINDHKEFPFKTLLTKLKTFDTALHKVLNSNLDIRDRQYIVKESAKLFANAKECLATHGQSISLLKEIKFKEANRMLFNIVPQFESMETVTKKSKLATIYNKLKSYDVKKVLPIYCALDQYTNSLVQKAVLLDDLRDVEDGFRNYLYKSLGKEIEFYKKTAIKLSSEDLDMLKSQFPKDINPKTIENFNKFTSLFADTGVPNSEIAHLNNEILSHQFFSDDVVEKYNNGYTKYVAQLNDTKNLNGVINENGFLKLAGLKKNDFVLIKSNQAIETLKFIEKYAHESSYALVTITKHIPYESFEHYQSTKQDQFKTFKTLYNMSDQNELVQYSKNRVSVDISELKAKPSGTIFAKSARAAKRGILSRLVGRIVMGPEMLAYDAFQIGVLTLTGLVMAKRYIYEHIGWSEPSPEQYSYDYYTKRLKHLHARKDFNQLTFASNQNNILGIKSQKIQTLEKQQFLLDAEIELTKLNLKTTAVCGLSLDVSQQAMSDMDHSMRQIQSLSNSIREIDQYESEVSMLRGRGVYPGEALEERRPSTSLSKHQIVSKINDHVKTYNMAQRLVLDYEKGLAKVQLMDQAQNFYNLLCVKENKKPESLFDNKYGMLLNKLNYKN